jgi:antitoxin (DNA-binding transcriptional repressor) of toxin-antitoxin stability system
MYQVNLAEAITRLRDLINAAVSGETVFIKNDHQVVQLVPVLPSERRPQFGSAKGLIEMADDFDAPLADFDEYKEKTMALKQMEQQVAQLSPQEQLKLVAYIAEQLSATPLGAPTKEIEGQAQRTRLAEVDAWLAECDAVAESIEGEFDSAKDLRQIREERASRL